MLFYLFDAGLDDSKFALGQAGFIPQKGMGAPSNFVPWAKPAPSSLVKALQQFLNNATSLVVITGAGVSTESGIPDYRSPLVGQYARKNHRPIQHMDFMTNEYWRRRYWARNFLAYSRFSTATCNLNHSRLAAWEKSENFNWLITQNVDGLHTKAGSIKLTELHGSARQVVCMSCGLKYSRDLIQKIIAELNPDWRIEQNGQLAPDGDVDADISDNALAQFRLPFCSECGERSILKTDVVFFGDNVARRVADLCYEKMENADALLILGSSLSVMSGYRFVSFAHLRQMPIAIVNIGPTRADHLAYLKIEANCSEVLNHVNIV